MNYCGSDNEAKLETLRSHTRTTVVLFQTILKDATPSGTVVLEHAAHLNLETFGYNHFSDAL